MTALVYHTYNIFFERIIAVGNSSVFVMYMMMEDMYMCMPMMMRAHIL